MGCDVNDWRCKQRQRFREEDGRREKEKKELKGTFLPVGSG